MRKATHQLTKEHNRNLVLKTIIESDSISRAAIARSTGLTRTTVSDLVSELLAEGLVKEIGVGSSIGGKSPILLSLAADSRYVIGLDLAHNLFRGAVINLCGEIRKVASRPVDDRNGEEALTLVYEILDELIQSEFKPLVGIGVGTPGLVNDTDGVVVDAVNLDWEDLPLASLLNDRYQLPVYILNDSQAAAMAEYAYGKNNGAEDNLLVINVRHGIGAGIVIGGQLFTGDGGGAGEIGHVVVVPENGLPCRCGNHGCLETVASVQAIVRRMQTTSSTDGSSPAASPHSTLDRIEAAFVNGEPLARQAVLEAGHYLGRAIAGLIGALNIRKVVLAGDMTRFGQPWLDIIRETKDQSTLGLLAHNTQIEIGQVGPDGVLLGASALLLRDYSLLFIH